MEKGKDIIASHTGGQSKKKEEGGRGRGYLPCYTTWQAAPKRASLNPKKKNQRGDTTRTEKKKKAPNRCKSRKEKNKRREMKAV